MGITVSDSAQTVAFYEALTEVTVTGPLVKSGPVVEAVTGQTGAEIWITFIGFADGDTMLELAEYRGVQAEPVNPVNNRPGATHPAIVVPDIEASIGRLATAGYVATAEPQMATSGPLDGYRYAYVIGPDELRVELLQESHSD